MKNPRRLFLVFLFLYIGFNAYPNPGDTTLVQCFSFDSIYARRGIFLFPPQGTSYEKVLMYYTIKCDPLTPWDSYNCGEWDYTTFTHIYEHTGDYDSTLYFHPYFTVNGMQPYSFSYLNSPLAQPFPRREYFWQHTNTISMNLADIGSGSIPVETPFGNAENDAKHLVLFKAAELTEGGLNAGNITGLRFYAMPTGADVQRLRVRIKPVAIDDIGGFNYLFTGFSTVFDRNVSIDEEGWFSIDFLNYFAWDGVSNILVEFSYSGISGSLPLAGEELLYNCCLTSEAPDNAIRFNGPDYIEVPATSVADLNQKISIAFWLNGDHAIQPQNDMLLEACDASKNRKLCIHLPWGDGSVYWDAGNNGAGYDRINKSASPDEYKGKWNFWVFTKDASTGVMQVYLNGVLWLSGTGKTALLNNISTFVLGSNVDKNPEYCYDGMLDEFMVFNTALNQTDIENIMYHPLEETSALWNNLILYYPFDEGSGSLLTDASQYQHNTNMMGMPDWISYHGINRYKYFTAGMLRPNTIFEQAEYESTLDSLTVFDTLYSPQVQVITYANQDNYTIVATDTSLYYPARFLTAYDVDGVALDSVYFSDATIYNASLEYYSQPFEVINTYQVQNFVTPYGIGLNLGSTGFTWVYDVTDYISLLHDSVDISAHNTQELLDLKFALIEGTPSRNVIEFSQLWRGNYSHHGIASDEQLPGVKILANPNASMFTIRTRTTGHGMEGDGNCSEFCPTYHKLYVDGAQRYEWLNWKECSTNPIYPQGGTWIFDRAGWCPGNFADTYDWDITDWVTPGDSVLIDYGMEQYPGSNGEGNYQIAVQAFQYSAPNFLNDAAIDVIVAPTDADEFVRYNPVCSNPVIRIKNNGATTLNSLEINYGISGNTTHQFIWTGNLDFLETEEVILPALSWLDFTGDSQSFEVTVTNPNNTEDEYEPNNHSVSHFVLADVYDQVIMLVVKTNNYGSQTYYDVTDSEGNILVSRDNLDNNTYYYDTLDFDPGCYVIHIYDRDEGFIGQDGLNFWYWANTPYDDGTGFAKLRVPGGAYVKHFNADFGSFLTYQFIYPDASYILNEKAKKDYFSLYPNPCSELVNVEFYEVPGTSDYISIFDVSGRQVKQIHHMSNNICIDVSDLQKGMYVLKYISGNITSTRSLIVQ
ncbi:MAG: T9SS type A sorting domain-containing protein [Bacteroidales bacterium]|nr:T9SS type A sorting domain-containing protein [Bacteroidales bacterium]HQP03584.1 peptide-N-glycosidase F-related protein [Bacteroidales bacterium]